MNKHMWNQGRRNHQADQAAAWGGQVHSLGWGGKITFFFFFYCPEQRGMLCGTRKRRARCTQPQSPVRGGGRGTRLYHS